MSGRMFFRFPRSLPVFVCVLGMLAVVCLIWYFQEPWVIERVEPITIVEPQKQVVNREPRMNAFNHSTGMPLIFIGGIPRSGTTLLRVMLDAHPDIRCAQETQVIPEILAVTKKYREDPGEVKQLKESGITPEVLDPAVAAFILEIIVRHGDPAPRLCNKDPYNMEHAVYLHSLFPNAKFILMLRDGRAVVHSIINRNIAIMGFTKNYRFSFWKWNEQIHTQYDECLQLGPSRCLTIHYELLVMHPRPMMEQILTFLDVPWNETVLQHEKFVNKPGGIALSMLEDSTDQVIKPINVKALTSWIGHIPQDVERDLADIAPMLKIIGYDPHSTNAYFGKADYSVERITKEIENNHSFWSSREKEIRDKSKAMKMEIEKLRSNSKMVKPQS